MSELPQHSISRVRRFALSRDRFRKEHWGLPLAISMVLVWGSRVATWLAYPSGVRFPDSDSYAPRSFGDWGLVSFSGDATRPWPVPLLFSMIPNDTLRVATQLLLSGVTWSLLLVVLAAFVSPGWGRLIFMTFGSVVASAPASLQWDTVVLAQSVHTALMVLAITFIMLSFRQTIRWPHAALFVIVLLFLALTKITHLPLVIIFAIMYGFLGLKQRIGYRKVSTIVIGAVVSIAIAVPLLNNVDRHWDFSYSGVSALYALGSQTPGSASFKEFLSSRGAPDCLLETAPFDNWAEDVEGPVFRDCPEAKPFIRNKLSGLLLEYRLTRPLETIRVGAQGFGAATITNSLRYGGTVSLVPGPLSDFVFGKSDPDILTLGGADQIELSQQVLSGEGFWVFSPQSTWVVFASLALIFLIKRRRTPYELRVAIAVAVLVMSLLLESFGSLALLSSEWVRLISPYLNPVLVLSMFSIALLLAPQREEPGFEK